MKRKRKIIATAILTTFLVLLSACGGKAKPDTSSAAEVSTESSIAAVDIKNLLFMNPLIPPDGSEVGDDVPNLVPKLLAADAQNKDAIAWLNIPNTTVDEVVVKHEADTNNSNAFYLRKGFDGSEDKYGTYYVDYRNVLDKGRENFSKNTVIYGHSFTDNINGLKMDQLKKFREVDGFAENNPYIFLSTADENLAFEIFAVYDTTINMHYNNPSMNDAEFQDIVSEATKRSYFNYDVQVDSSDKILTLSTCTYKYTTVYPNNYRYVIMARLVSPDEKLKDKAVLEKNSARKAP